jgi:hypothetical protein
MSLLTLALFIGPVWAGTTYYVSPNGNDAADGTSPSTPFRTLSRASQLSLGQGDSLLLERGGVWRAQQLIVRFANGSADQPVTVGAYGTGAAPKILGSIDVNDADWTPVPNRPNVYRNTVGRAANAFYDADRFVTRFTSVSQVYATPNSYASVGGSLYYNTGGKNIGSVDTKMGVSDRLMWVRDSQHVIVENIESSDSGRIGGGVSFKVDTSSDVTLRNLRADNAGRHHYEIVDSNRFLGENLQANYAMPGQGSTAFVSYSGVDSLTRHDNHVWKNIRYHDPATRSGIFYTHGDAVGDISIEGIYSDTGNPFSIATEGSNQKIVIKGGDVGGINLQGNNTTVDGLRVSGNNVNIQVDGDNNVLQNLLLDGIVLDSIKPAAIFITGVDNVVRFNTISMGPTPSRDVTGISVTSTGTAEVYGNVITNADNPVRYDNPTVFSDLNVFDNEVLQVFRTKYDLNSWKNLGYDLNSVIGNPIFEDPSIDDFTLLPGFPGHRLIDKILSDEQIPLDDFLGRVRMLTVPADAGAFQTVTIPEVSSLTFATLAFVAAAIAVRRRPMN